jgi:hypothetical protein
VTRPPDDLMRVDVRPSFLANQPRPEPVPLPGELFLVALVTWFIAAWCRWREWTTRERPSADEMSRSWRMDHARRGW